MPFKNEESRRENYQKNRERILEGNKRWLNNNRGKRNEYLRKRYEKIKNDPYFKNMRRKNKLKKEYGITPEMYETILQIQNFVCAICGNEDSANSLSKNLVVDHDHKTGKIRGLLCHRCNHLLGNAKDDLLILGKAIDYLKKHIAP